MSWQPVTKTVWKTREVHTPCSTTQMGGSINNPGPVPCSICGGSGRTTHTEHYQEQVTEYEFVHDDKERGGYGDGGGY